MGVTSNKGCTGPWEPVDTEKVHYEFTGCPDDAKVYNEVVWGDSEDITFGQYNEVCAGAYLDITVGMLLEVVIGPMLEVCVGGSFEMAGMPAAMWKLGGLFPQTSERVAAQYDIVFGTYYETLYDGAMYYWQAADDEAFTIHEDWVTRGTTLDHIRVYEDHAEVVGSKVIVAVGTGGIRYIAANTLGVTIVGASVQFNASSATVAVELGNLQLSGIIASLQASTSCSVNALDSQLLVAGDTITASSSTSLKLNAALQEWGQPGVEQPPPAVEAAEAPASEVPEDVDLPLGFALDMFPVV
jgi:hypothetical protein